MSEQRSNTARTSRLAVWSLIFATVFPILLVLSLAHDPTGERAVKIHDIGVNILSSACLYSAGLSAILGIAALISIRRSGWSRPGVGYAVFGIAISVFVLFWGMLFSMGHGEGQEASCESNLKQIGTAMYCYAQDHHGRLPDAKNWIREICPDFKGGEPYHCPGSDSRLPSYAMNSSLSGVKMQAVNHPDRTVLIFESAPGMDQSGGPELLPRKSYHKGTYGIVFVDGQVRFCTKDQLLHLMSWSNGGLR